MSAKKSRFGFLADALNNPVEMPVEEAPAPELTPPSEEPPPSPALAVIEASKYTSKKTAKPRPQSTDVPRTPGRPPGKRSDGDHVQVTAYIRADTRRRVRRILNDNEGGPDFSELVEELLAKWLKSRT